MMFAVGPVTVDLSLPAMPTIQHEIGTAGLPVELTLTILFAGLSASQFIYGAVADRFGRRKPLLMALVIYCVACVAGALAPSTVALSVARFFQAAGFGISVLLIRSAVVDISDERRTASVFSSAVTIVSLASVIAPTVGGQLLAHFGWRSVFFVMGAFGLVVLGGIALFLPETLPAQRRSAVPLARIFGTYIHLLQERRFAAFCVISAAAAAYQFTYNTGSPSVLIEHYGLTPSTTGLLFSLIALSTAVASQVNALLLKWAHPDRIMSGAVLLSVVASFAVLLSVFTDFGGVSALIAALFVLISTIGFIMGNSMAGAISSAGSRAGAASALVGVVQFLFGTLGSAFVGLSHEGAGRLMGIALVVLSLGSLAMSLRARPTGEHAAST
jgi:DHA1 family bicyclomycin/chloramphenicol resistance-like MFS transporter